MTFSVNGDNARRELWEAGIAVILVGLVSNQITANCIGLLGPIVFTRQGRYWRADGLVPLDAAQTLYADEDGPSIRATGHCDGPDPVDVFRRYTILDGRRLEVLADSEYQKALGELGHVGHGMVADFREKYLRASDVPRGQRVIAAVDGYDIDTQSGLNFFAQVIRGYAAEIALLHPERTL